VNTPASYQAARARRRPVCPTARRSAAERQVREGPAGQPTRPSAATAGWAASREAIDEARARRTCYSHIAVAPLECIDDFCEGHLHRVTLAPGLGLGSKESCVHQPAIDAARNREGRRVTIPLDRYPSLGCSSSRMIEPLSDPTLPMLLPDSNGVHVSIKLQPVWLTA